jgi:hypothetical protein
VDLGIGDCSFYASQCGLPYFTGVMFYPTIGREELRKFLPADSLLLAIAIEH